jgi:PIN domain nuclease of toxin-antitoxin system
MSSDVVAVSAITFLEVATLARRGRITLRRPAADWLQESVDRSSTRVIDVTLAIATSAGSLQSEIVGDPADRLIVATALQARVPLVTKDRKIIASGIVPTIW